MERGPAPPVLNIGVCAGVEHEGDRVDAVVVAGPVERRASIRADGVGRCTGRHQLGHNPPMASDGRPVESCVPVHHRIGRLGIVFEELVDGVAVAAFGGIDDIGHRVFGRGDRCDNDDHEQNCATES